MKLISMFLMALCLMAVALPAGAQTPKLGHVDTQKLMEAMPAYKTAQQTLRDYVTSLQTQATKMQSEMDRLTDAYYKDEPTLSASMKEIRQQEIKDLGNRIQMLQSTSEDDVNQKQSELVKPLQDKLLAAVKSVATEKGYSYIFDSSAGVVLYLPPADDITDLVKAKLAIP